MTDKMTPVVAVADGVVVEVRTASTLSPGTRW